MVLSLKNFKTGNNDDLSLCIGHVCEGGPGSDQLTVCGMCGLLFEVSFPLGAHTM